VLHNEVAISGTPFCVNIPPEFVSTNGGVPVSVKEVVVILLLGAFAVAHNGVLAFAYVS
jgi:hypothetical protein